MKSFWLLLFAVFSIETVAAEEVMIGAHSAGGFAGLYVGDTNHFNHIEKQFGVYRYGFGHSNLVVGNGIGLGVSGSSGFVWKEWSHASGFGPLVGLEGAGFLNVNSNLAANNATVYQWLPGASIGLQYLGPVHVTLATKAGAGVGNYSAPNLTPVIDPTLGVGLYIWAGNVQFGTEVVRWGQNFKFSADVLVYVRNYPVSVQYDSFSGGVRAPSQNLSLLIKGFTW